MLPWQPTIRNQIQETQAPVLFDAFMDYWVSGGDSGAERIRLDAVSEDTGDDLVKRTAVSRMPGTD